MFDSQRISMYLILIVFLMICGYIMFFIKETFTNIYSNYPVSLPHPFEGCNCKKGCNYGSKYNCRQKEGMCGCEKKN